MLFCTAEKCALCLPIEGFAECFESRRISICGFQKMPAKFNTKVSV